MGSTLLCVMFGAVEKFSDELYPAAFIFIEIDIFGGLNLIHTEAGGVAMDAEPWEDVIAQISIKRVFSGKMSKVSHEIPICFRRSDFGRIIDAAQPLPWRRFLMISLIAKI